MRYASIHKRRLWVTLLTLALLFASSSAWAKKRGSPGKARSPASMDGDEVEASSSQSDSLVVPALSLSQVKFSPLLQAWFLNDTSVPQAWLNFRVRRAELGFSGDVGDRAFWFVMADAAKLISGSGDSKVLQDAGVGFRLGALDIVAGQMQVPLTREGFELADKLLLPERSLPARRFGDRREPGLMLSLRVGGTQARAMFSTGSGANVDDKTNSKDLAVRLDHSFSRVVSVGAYTQLRDMGLLHHAIGGVNLRLEPEPLRFRLEASLGRHIDLLEAGGTGEISVRFGAFEPAVRYELYRPDLAVSVLAQAASLGLNYHAVTDVAKVQLSVSRMEGMSGSGGTPEFNPDFPTHTLFILAFVLGL